MSGPARASIVEVGPRDGLQSLDGVFDTDVKLSFIERVIAAGITEIEAAGFVHPDMVPQLADAERLMERVPRPPEVAYRGLAPNRRGAERAVKAGVDSVLGLLSASEAYSRKNQNMSIEEALAALGDVADVAGEAGKPVTVVVSCAIFSPWEGFVAPEHVLELVERALTFQPAEISVATTAGMAGPRRLGALCRRIRAEWPELPLSVHLHDADGLALVNAMAAWEAGVDRFDASLCGIGGGVALAAGRHDTGNVATEDLVTLLSELGIATGLDPAEVIAAARDVSRLLGLDRTGSTARTGTPEELMARYREM